jgi:hypothetical protein
MKKIRLLLIWLPLAVVGLFVIMLVLAPAQVVSSAAGVGGGEEPRESDGWRSSWARGSWCGASPLLVGEERL